MTWAEWVEHVSEFTAAKIAGWVLGISAVFLALKKVWPWLKAFVRMVDTIATLPDRLDGIEKSQAMVKKELTDNHGSSLKDAVKRVEEKVDQNLTDLDAHIQFCKQREQLLAAKPKEQS